MQKERDSEIDQHDEDFKNLIFANNPKLYHDLFVQPAVVQSTEESDIYLPQTVGDVANLLSDLKELGVELKSDDLD